MFRQRLLKTSRIWALGIPVRNISTEKMQGVIAMKQDSSLAKQSADSICGVDEAWQNNGSKRLTFPKDTIAAGRRHTVGLKSDGTVTAVGDNKYDQCDVNGWRGIQFPSN